MKNRLFIGFMLFAVLITAACCKDKCSDPADSTCENYDPCFKKVSADFKMRIQFLNDVEPKVFEVDTVVAGRTVYFTALDTSDAQYEWIFSNDPDTIRERSTAVQFTFPTSLTVKLIVKRKSNCGLKDGGTDTISKKLVVVEVANTERQLLGKYEGVNQSNPTDKFVIELVYDTRLFRYYIQNLPKGCTRDRTTAYGSLWGFDYKYLDIGDWDIGAQKECSRIVGFGEINRAQQTIQITYRYIDYTTLQTIKNTFIGKKI